MKNILVIIPAYNEEQNIKKVIEELKNDLPDADYIVINDCSSDNTLCILKETDVNYINLPINLGYSGALQTGFKYALINNYDYVMQFDGDGQHIAKEVYKLYELMQTEIDIAIGSRFMNTNEYVHSFFRKIGSNIFKMIIKLSCKQNISDPTSGFQMLNKSVYSKYAKIGYYPEYPDANLIIDMLHSGYRIKETPVLMRNREFGHSMHSGIIKPLKYMIQMCYSIFLISMHNEKR